MGPAVLINRYQRVSTSSTTGLARLAAAVITYSATTGSSPRASSAARAAWAADPRMWRTCVAFASGWRYAAAEASPAARDATTEAARHAASAAGGASAAAYLHPLAKATQVRHILGSAAHAAQAADPR